MSPNVFRGDFPFSSVSPRILLLLCEKGGTPLLHDLRPEERNGYWGLLKRIRYEVSLNTSRSPEAGFLRNHPTV
ncbi:MAG: hypothetical protein WD295_05770 [Bacteroidota bacterium]